MIRHLFDDGGKNWGWLRVDEINVKYFAACCVSHRPEVFLGPIPADS
jgi:hypothetical protein